MFEKPIASSSVTDVSKRSAGPSIVLGAEKNQLFSFLTAAGENRETATI